MINDKNNSKLEAPPKTSRGRLATVVCSTLPDHHIRYARAWYLWQSENIPEDAKITLENEMDSAQNDFNFDEFQEFKKTLTGYSKYWENILTRVLS